MSWITRSAVVIAIVHTGAVMLENAIQREAWLGLFGGSGFSTVLWGLAVVGWVLILWDITSAWTKGEPT